MKLLFLFFFVPLLSFAQLPKRSVILENGIVKMTVWHHELPSSLKGCPPELFDSDSRVKTDTTVIHQNTWFFDERGRPTKCNSIYEGKERIGIFKFDDQDRLIEKTYYRAENETFRQTVVRSNDSKIEFKYWRDGELFDHYLTAADSTLLFAYPLKKGQLMRYRFDRDSNYRELAYYKNNKLRTFRKEQWHLNSDGTPESVEIDFKQYERATKRNGKDKSYHLIFPVGPNGKVESLPTQRPPIRFFAARAVKRDFISEYDFQTFNVDVIVDRTSDLTIMTYDVIDPRYYLSFDYFYTLDE